MHVNVLCYKYLCLCYKNKQNEWIVSFSAACQLEQEVNTTNSAFT
jgi:hypothetical protein